MSGSTFGTSFYIIYQDSMDRDFSLDIKEFFQKFDKSLSTYRAKSFINEFNFKKEIISTDTYFNAVFELSKEVYDKTNGYFDPTVGSLVELWGFGSENHKNKPIQQQIDSVMNFVGFSKVYNKGDTYIKDHQHVKLNFNALAKGYGVDIIAEFLNDKGIKNYLIEIGGEIRAKGVNEEGKVWSVGIEEPNYNGNRSIKSIVHLKNQSMATSGNYRKYKIDSDSGEMYGHTLNPFKGISAKTDMLSASVISDIGCGYVDGFATAMMAMGFEKAKSLALKEDLLVYFIYSEGGEMKVYTNIRELL